MLRGLGRVLAGHEQRMIETFFAAVVGTSIAGAVIVFLAKTWIETRLKGSIKHEYDQKLEEFKQALETSRLEKQKIELVSELIAEWMANPSGGFSKEYRTRLNRLSFQASLWLPSPLAIELSKRLQNKRDAKTSWELVLFARHLLTGDSSLGVEHVTFWGSEFEKTPSPGAPAQQAVTESKPVV
jgi:hypothetical protein